MVSIRMIGEDNVVAFASGQAELELDAMTLVISPRPGVGYEKEFFAIIDPKEWWPQALAESDDGRRAAPSAVQAASHASGRRCRSGAGGDRAPAFMKVLPRTSRLAPPKRPAAHS